MKRGWGEEKLNGTKRKKRNMEIDIESDRDKDKETKARKRDEMIECMLNTLFVRNKLSLV